MTSQTDSSKQIKEAIQSTAAYLYHIDGKVPQELYVAIGVLRQLINEEFVGKNKTVSSQFIYDIMMPAIRATAEEVALEQITAGTK